jgi:hypothetical protein
MRRRLAVGFWVGFVVGVVTVVIAAMLFVSRPVHAQGMKTNQTAPKAWGGVKAISDNRFLIFEDSAGTVRDYDMFAGTVFVTITRQ